MVAPEHTCSLDSAFPLEWYSDWKVFSFILYLRRVISPGKRSIQLYGEWGCLLWPGVLANFCFTVAEHGCHLYRWLFRDGLLPNDTYFVGFARSDLTVEDIMTACLPFMKVEALLLVYAWEAWLCAHKPSMNFQVTDEQNEFLSVFFSKNSYVRGRYDDSSSFAELSHHLSSLPGGRDSNRLFYLALPPTVYQQVGTNISTQCMSDKCVSVVLKSTNPERVSFFNLWWAVFVTQRLEQDNSWEALWPGPPEFTRALISSVLLIQRGPDLPHWPLPGQRDGPEPHGSQVTAHTNF